MTILVTGGTGQLATALVAEGGRTVHRVGRPAFDFDRPATVTETFAAVSPTLVVNNRQPNLLLFILFLLLHLAFLLRQLHLIFLLHLP